MVEIVFSESACGSLKIAQTYGRGKYRGSAISVFIRHENGSVPSSNEMKEAQLQAQEQECIAWENAIPLGGKSSDVYCFDMALSVEIFLIMKLANRGKMFSRKCCLSGL